MKSKQCKNMEEQNNKYKNIYNNVYENAII